MQNSSFSIFLNSHFRSRTLLAASDELCALFLHFFVIFVLQMMNFAF